MPRAISCSAKLTSTREDLAVTASNSSSRNAACHTTRSNNGVTLASPSTPSTFPSSRYGGPGGPTKPAALYRPARSHLPQHDREVLVTARGRICMHRKPVNISTVLAGQRLVIEKVDNGIWIVSFMSYDLGFSDLQQKTLQPSGNPLGPRMSPTS